MKWWRMLWATVFAILACEQAQAGPLTSLRHTATHLLIGGSGAYIETDLKVQYVLTNWHVCNLSQGLPLNIETEDGITVEGTVAHSDIAYDLCIVKVPRRKVALPVGRHLAIGDKLFSHGWPKHVFRETEGSYKAHEEVALNVIGSLGNSPCPKEFTSKYNAFDILVGCIGMYPEGITTLFSAPGSSGSAVVNSEGQLVGVIQSSAEDTNAFSAGIIELYRIREFLKGY